MKFSELNLHPSLMEGLDAMGFEQTTPIQAQSIPELIKGRDLIGCAQTGTGKTAAFLIPVIQRVVESTNDGVKALVIAPTRELAIQIDQQLQGLGYFAGVSSIAIYGGKDGTSWDFEKQSLMGGADVIICTPGRVIAHMGFEYVNFDKLECLILDEADRMLDMGFHDDIMKIVELTPKSRQTMLFSATMPPKIRKLAQSLLKDPLSVEIAISKPSENISQVAYMVHDGSKERLLELLMAEREVNSCIIFCSTKDSVKSVNKRLQRKGWKAAAISSDLEQAEREEVLNAFRNRKLNFLVATDVLSRGIDIDNIEIVVNYEVPRDAEDYVHRIGRTARAGASGQAITFINEDDVYRFADIERLIERTIEKPKLPDELGEGPEYNPSERRNGGGRNRNRNRKGGSHKPSGHSGGDGKKKRFNPKWKKRKKKGGGNSDNSQSQSS
ncbi:MAG: DEAD/DEAH box helicase [Flavobacteriales bacterium]|nr:DEAD/DEAH box helicase [Flavobacteriales bacterium]